MNGHEGNATVPGSYGHQKGEFVWLLRGEIPLCFGDSRVRFKVSSMALEKSFVGVDGSARSGEIVDGGGGGRWWW